MIMTENRLSFEDRLRLATDTVKQFIDYTGSQGNHPPTETEVKAIVFLLTYLGSRRRCGIPEHRKHIKSLQKWCKFLETSQAGMWQRNRADNLEHDKTKLKAANTQREMHEEINKWRSEAEDRPWRWAAIGFIVGAVLMLFGR